MIGKASLLIFVAAGFGILMIIGLPGLIIHYVKKMRGRPAATEKDPK